MIAQWFYGPPVLEVEIDGAVGRYPVEPFDASQDLTTKWSGPVQDGGSGIRLEGNNWKQVEVNHTLTADTALKFDFKSSAQGEIHVIGVSDDLSIDSSDEKYGIYGDDIPGPPAGYDTTYTYTGAGAWQSFDMPIGTLGTGSRTYLFFGNDDDASAAAESYYRNVEFYEDTGAGSIIPRIMYHRRWMGAN